MGKGRGVYANDATSECGTEKGNRGKGINGKGILTTDGHEWTRMGKGRAFGYSLENGFVFFGFLPVSERNRFVFGQN
jgi:hypothetical protein